MYASVIIPTYNRKESVLRTLHSLSEQTLAGSQCEVVVVDDGSTDDTPSLADSHYPFAFRYIRQDNQGGVSARNYGSEIAEGDLLIFLDDDMVAEPGYIEGLVKAHTGKTSLVSRGQLVPWIPDKSSIFNQISGRPNQSISVENIEANLAEFASNNMAIRRDEFWALGGWREIIIGELGLKGGIWADLEFAYRAGQSGFSFVTVTSARICHRDYVTLNLEATCRRYHKVSQWAVPLMQQYPGIEQYLPMYWDKHPINWQQDSIGVIGRKLFRITASQPFSISVLEYITHYIEQYAPRPSLLIPLYRWVVGGYIFQGYREGLREYGAIEKQKEVTDYA